MHLKPYIHVHLHLFSRQTEQPLAGEAYRVQLFDNDLFRDDFLGEGAPDAHGMVEITFNTGQFQNWDSPGERFPDLYFRVLESGQELFRSPVAGNLDLLKTGDFNMEQGLRVDLGSWVI